MIRLWGKDSIRRCVVGVDAGKNIPLSEVDAAARPLYLSIVKYRMPIADIFHVNRHFYVLFSRDCDAKRLLLEQMKENAAREGLVWDEYLCEHQTSNRTLANF